MIRFREIEERDRAFLSDMLYEMVYVPENEAKPPREQLLQHPGLAVYLDKYGERAGDAGYVACNEEDVLVAAGWYRLYEESNSSYGFMNSDTPELGMAVVREYRGKGIGSRLLAALLERARADGYPGLSLSTDSRNPAARIYCRAGFKIVSITGLSWIMHRDFRDE